MREKKIVLKRNFNNQRIKLLLQEFFNAINVPEHLVDATRRFQEECIAQGIEDAIHFKASVVERCDIQIGNLYFDLKTLDEEKIRKYLKAREEEKGQETGQIAWQFRGVNQFGSVTIRLRDRRWQVEFSRLQRRISSVITTEASLKPKAHQDLYEEMKKRLHPLSSSDPSQMLILQGAPGLGKSHCAEHYFYHEANQHHQMLAWLSGGSEEAFLNDWQSLANQLRYIDSEKREHSNDEIIHHWCEKQLGQWLFIIDDVQVEISWLRQHLPKKGGSVLITTSTPLYSLPEDAQTLPFLPLNTEDSEALLKVYLGSYWDPSSYKKEGEALAYLSHALSGSPTLLIQMALLVRKKGLSFERLMEQFQDAETRNLLLSDAVFDQLEGKTFKQVVEKSLKHIATFLHNLYPQFDENTFKEPLKQFIGLLEKETLGIERTGFCYISDIALMKNWKIILDSLLPDLEIDKLRKILTLLPLSYDDKKQTWEIALAGLHALKCTQVSPAISNLQISCKSSKALGKEEEDLPKIPSGANLFFSFENSALGDAKFAILTTNKPSEMTAWRLPTTNPYFIPRPALTEEMKDKLTTQLAHEKRAELVLAAASGMGGIGKTELARYFITEPSLSSDYSSRFWFYATSTSELRNEFYDLAVHLGFIEPKKYVEDKELIQLLHGWFNRNRGWLIVFDNADDYNSIAEWVPKEGGSVLITTREPNPGTLIDKQIVKVLLLKEEEAIDWLYQLAQRDQSTATESERKAARELVGNLGLGYLPLAIAQAAGYLREQRQVTIEEYLKDFIQLLLKEKSLVSTQEENGHSDPDAGARCVVASTWRLSLKAIGEYVQKNNIPNYAPYLLTACSYLAPKDIPIELLQDWFKDFFSFEDISSKFLSYYFDEYTGQLLRYSLCERSDLTKVISIHRLVQEVLRSNSTKELPKIKDWTEKIKQKDNVKEEIINSLLEVLYKHSDNESSAINEIKKKIALLPHMQSIKIYCEKIGCNNIHFLKMLDSLLKILAFRRNPEDLKSIGSLSREIEAYESKVNFPIDKEDKILTKLTISHTYFLAAEYSAQVAELTEIEAEIEKNENSYSPEIIIQIHHDFAMAHYYLKNKELCKKHIIEALSFKVNTKFEANQEAAFLNNVAIIFDYLGDDDLKKHYIKQRNSLINDEKSVEALERKIADAVSLSEQGKTSEAIACSESLLPVLRKIYGNENIKLAPPLVNLSIFYSKSGKFAEAKDLILEAFRIKVENYSIDNFETIKTALNVRAAFHNLGREKNNMDCFLCALSFNEICLQYFESNEQYDSSRAYRNETRSFKEKMLKALLFSSKNKNSQTLRAFLNFSRIICLWYSKQKHIVTTLLNEIFDMTYNACIDINGKDKDGLTMLHHACNKKDIISLIYLLEIEKNVFFDIKDGSGKLAWEYVKNTSLLELFKTDSILVQFLKKYPVKSKSNPNTVDWGHVLRTASANGLLADVRFLIEVKGIDINSADANPKSRYTPLHLAVIKNKPEIAEYLIDKNANFNATDANQKTPIDYIEERENKESWYKIFCISTKEPESEYLPRMV